MCVCACVCDETRSDEADRRSDEADRRRFLLSSLETFLIWSRVLAREDERSMRI